MRAARTLMLLVVLASVAALALAEGTVSVSINYYVYIEEEQLWEYDYRISNTTSGDDLAYAFYISLTGIDQAAIVHYPVGYGDYEWLAVVDGWASWDARNPNDPNDWANWVAPEESLSGFTIRSRHGPAEGKAEWIAYADTLEEPPSEPILYTGGDIIGPMVPEPASMALMALTLGIVGGAVRRRRARGKEGDTQVPK